MRKIKKVLFGLVVPRNRKQTELNEEVKDSLTLKDVPLLQLFC